MRLGRLFLAFLSMLLLFSAIADAQQLWSTVLSPSRAIDWSRAGAPQINAARTQCTTSACELVCPKGTNPCGAGGTVTASSLTAALASAAYNSYVLVPAGSYTLDSAVYFPIGGSNSSSCTSNCSNVTLRGMGANQTFLYFDGTTAPNDCSGSSVCAASTDSNYEGGPSNTATFEGASTSSSVASGTYTSGGTYILLSSVKNLQVGAPIILDQLDNTGDNGALYVGCEIGTDSSQQVGNPPVGDPSGACPPFAHVDSYERGASNLSTIRGQQQIVNVVSISGSGPYTVQVTPGLYAANWSTSQSPGAWWATSPVYNDGVEDLYINPSADPDSGKGVNFFNCTGCWAKGISVVTTSSGGTGWYSVGFNICNHCTVTDSYHYGFTGDDYGFANYIGSDNLFENNISEYPGEIFISNSDCEGCVADYNFAAGILYTSSSTWFSPPVFYHGVELYTLLEGNIGGGLWADFYHGTHVLNTDFRNRWDGIEQNGGAITSVNTMAVQLASGSRYNNIIGDVLGTPGYHTTYKATPTSRPGSLWQTVLDLGVSPTVSTNDGLVAPTTMLWGNWDSVDDAARWCAGPTDAGWDSSMCSTSEVPTTIDVAQNYVQQCGTGDGSQTSFSCTLTNTPLVKGNTSAYLCASSGCTNAEYLNSTLASDQANGTLQNNGATSGAISGTVNYTTGAVTLSFGSAPPSGTIIYVNYLQQTSTPGEYTNFVPSTTTLPASFIYSSMPSWWPSGKAWPDIGPDVTGGNVGQCSGGMNAHSEVTSSQSSQCTAGGGTFTALEYVVSNPAMDCYFNVLGGSANGTGPPLSFNASSCYSGSGTSTLSGSPNPAAPQSLTGTVVPD